MRACVRASVRTSVLVCEHACKRVCECMCACMRASVCVCKRPSVRASERECVSACVRACERASVQTCIACVRMYVVHDPNPVNVSFQIKQISEAWKYHALRKSPKHNASVPRPRPRRGTKPREMYTEVH